MPRRVQDIVPGDRRSIREIPLRDEKPRRSADEGSARSIPIHRNVPSAIKRMPVTPPPEKEEKASKPRPRRRSKSRLTRLFVALGIIVVIGAIGFIATARYSRASFVIVPKSLPVSVNATYVAAPAGGSGLTYELMTLKGIASTTIPAKNGQTVSQKASGIVTVYNAFSPQALRLIAGTRLAGDSKLVYRLTSSIVIPGYTKSGGSLSPGTVRATVIADQPGSNYNISGADPVSDLKVVAYAGGPRYDTVYARLAGAVTGGFVGTKKIVDPVLLASTTDDLKASIIQSLASQAASAVPADYILYSNAYVPSFDPASTAGGDQQSAVVSEQGTVNFIMFKRSALVSKFTSGQSDSAFGSYGFDAKGLDALKVTFANLKDFSPAGKSSVVFHAQGSLTLVGNVPTDQIKAKLEGQPLSATQDILQTYSPVVESGSGELTPPWSKIPTDPSRIAITVKD
ncbi:MAG: hypothetical protein KGI45_03120 [Patescibacteria group bacterium]|nr:hypothetical protein [Patescibacteria group bacterium]MDE1940758.1 hypothetical protein [Patescibacteria group bacterium]MDE1967037.1 hypothetical protein [Patescibacteria group bacterium]